MITNRSLKNLHYLVAALAFTANVQAAETDISTEPLSTYTATSSTDVKPNVLFILDDSGSMDSNALPDWASSGVHEDYLFYNATFNGVTYNPAVKYVPPVFFNSDGTVNTTTYYSMTGTSTLTGGDYTATSGSPNWKAVPNDGFGIQNGFTSNLVGQAFYYTVIPGEYCSAPSMRSCTTATAPSASYPVPAMIRWCDSTALTNCRSNYDSTFKRLRMPYPRSSTLTVGASSNNVTHITVNGQEILSGTAAADWTANTFAQNIVDQINLCSSSIPTGSQCTVAGYYAIRSGSKVIISAPNAISAYTPVITQSTSSITATAFVAGYVYNATSTVPGENLRTNIISTVNSYVYPGTAAKASTRTDCAGTTCTYVEEMTNYANWWAYYHTRMQMMKTSASIAFSKLDKAADVTNNVSRFRVGYMTISDGYSTSDFLNLDEFKTNQKYKWYTALFGAKPASWTPLRAALSTAGQLYAGKVTSIHGVTVTDPLQYSCQQNYTILSTDGYWNNDEENSSYGPFMLDNSTNVGNQDGSLARPLYDGGNPQSKKRTSKLQYQTITIQQQTSQLQSKTSYLQSSTSNLQSSTSNLQSSTAQLQRRTSTDSGTNWTTWSNVTSCTLDNTNPTLTQCQYSAYTTPTNVASCTALAKDMTSPYTIPVATACTYTAWTTPTDVPSCTAVAQDTTSPHTIPVARACTYTAWTTPANVASCTALAQDTTSPHTIPVATACTYTAWTAPVGVSSCTPLGQDTTSTYTIPVATACATVITSAYGANLPSCTSSTIPDANGFTTQCLTTTGTWTNATSPCTVSSNMNCQYAAWSSFTTVAASSCTAVPQSTAPNYTVLTAVECQTAPATGGSSNSLADVAAYYYGTDLRSDVAADGTGTCTGPIISPSTTANNLCDNNVKPFGRDTATTQHMSTFTLGLGAQGEMVYTPDYWHETSGDFYDIAAGTSADPSNGICSWQAAGSGACNWPIPSSGDLKNIDDLWHAAIDGRGAYYSATDPATLASGLSSTLSAIINTPKPGTAAAAASSNPNVSSSDNYVFSSSYKSVEWYGELIRQQINVTTGILTGIQWSAMTLLDCAMTSWSAGTSYVAGATYQQGGKCYQVASPYTSDTSFGSIDETNSNRIVTAANSNVVPLASRTIYTKGTSGRILFNWASLSSAQKDYFTEPAITYVSSTEGLSQFCSTVTTVACLTSTEQTNNTIATGGAAGENLVNYLRGDRSHEGTYYRRRSHVLGDIVSSEGRYVKQPLFNYLDDNYGAFISLHATRQGAVYVAANDGMLHAFNADTGQESWAYIPAIVLPDIYKLADQNYSTKHQYFVDGTPEVGEICPNAPLNTCTAAEWQTILVGGMNRGGKGYYALDITNPASPQVLWEISTATTGFANLGYTYGNPKITKLKDGTWVVIFTSGYNNADGKGYLYIVKASDGSLLKTISTGVGDSTSPSGLARIAAHATQPQSDNTTIAVYGGDLFGNLWRFDINDDIGATGYDAQLLVTLKDSVGNAQPITAKPTVTSINGSPVVYVGTGQYLGTGDIADTSSQSFYAIKDKLDSTSYINPHSSTSGFVEQTLVSGTCPTGAPASICSPSQAVFTMPTSNAVNWSTKNGWYIDFLTGGERSTTDSSLGLGTLVFTSIAPQSATANVCGTAAPGCAGGSFAYALNYQTGGPVMGAYNVVAVSLGCGIATRPVLIRLADGTIIELIRTSGGSGGTMTGGGTSTGGEDMGNTEIKTPPIKPHSASGTRRSSWRTLQ